MLVDNGVGVVGNDDPVSSSNLSLNLDFQTGDEYVQTSSGVQDSSGPEFEVDPDVDLEVEPGADQGTNQDELEFEEDDEPGLEFDEKELNEMKERLLDIIRSFDTDDFLNGVPWHKLVVKASSHGIDKNIIEDLVNDLLDNGKVYEPMLGRIKATN